MEHWKVWLDRGKSLGRTCLVVVSASLVTSFSRLVTVKATRQWNVIQPSFLSLQQLNSILLYILASLHNWITFATRVGQCCIPYLTLFWK